MTGWKILRPETHFLTIKRQNLKLWLWITSLFLSSNIFSMYTVTGWEISQVFFPFETTMGNKVQIHGFKLSSQPKGGGSGMLRKARAKSFPGRTCFFSLRRTSVNLLKGPQSAQTACWQLLLQINGILVIYDMQRFFFCHIFSPPFFSLAYLWVCLFQESWEKNRPPVKLRQQVGAKWSLVHAG